MPENTFTLRFTVYASLYICISHSNVPSPLPAGRRAHARANVSIVLQQCVRCMWHKLQAIRKFEREGERDSASVKISSRLPLSAENGARCDDKCPRATVACIGPLTHGDWNDGQRRTSLPPTGGSAVGLAYDALIATETEGSTG